MATVTPATAELPLGINRLIDPLLRAWTMTLNGSTVTDTRPTTGGPLGMGYFRRTMTTANTTSPMTMSLSGAGTSAVPVTEGQPYTLSWYSQKSSLGPAGQARWAWYTAAGASISTTTGATQAVTGVWQRFRETMTAPPTAAFLRPILAWSGIALVGQTLDLANAQLEEGSVMSDWADGASLNPALILDYAYSRGSRNIVLEPFGSSYPTVFLRDAQSKSGTLSMLFAGAARAREAVEALGKADRYSFSEPTVGEQWDFVVTGDIRNEKQEGTDLWVVSAQVREVATL